MHSETSSNAMHQATLICYLFKKSCLLQLQACDATEIAPSHAASLCIAWAALVKSASRGALTIYRLFRVPHIALSGSKGFSSAAACRRQVLQAQEQYGLSNMAHSNICSYSAAALSQLESRCSHTLSQPPVDDQEQALPEVLAVATSCMSLPDIRLALDA